MRFSTLARGAARGFPASRCCGLGLALLSAAWGCALPGPAERGLVVATAPSPSEVERYCAWYGTRQGATLYFGQAAFWSTSRERGGDPRADLLHEGPLPIGRFDLETETLLPPLRADRPGGRSGVWDVLVAPGGSVFFTTFFEAAGRVDPRSGEVRHLDELGLGLNELAPGPDGGVLASRYGPGDAGDGDGGLVAFDVEGAALAEWPIRSGRDHQVAPKTPAWDPLRGELWATTDVLPRSGGAGPIRHPTFVLDAHGGLLRRIESPEIHFVAFGPDGTGYRAVVSGRQLRLEIAPASGAAERVLSKMGDAIVGPVRARLEAGTVEPEAAHSLLILLCDLGTRGAYETAVTHLDWFMEEIGPGASAEWICLFGSEELIEPLRDWLDEDPAMVGQALLLLGAIHNVRMARLSTEVKATSKE